MGHQNGVVHVRFSARPCPGYTAAIADFTEDNGAFGTSMTTR